MEPDYYPNVPVLDGYTIHCDYGLVPGWILMERPDYILFQCKDPASPASVPVKIVPVPNAQAICQPGYEKVEIGGGLAYCRPASQPAATNTVQPSQCPQGYTLMPDGNCYLGNPQWVDPSTNTPTCPGSSYDAASGLCLPLDAAQPTVISSQPGGQVYTAVGGSQTGGNTQTQQQGSSTTQQTNGGAQPAGNNIMDTLQGDFHGVPVWLIAAGVALYLLNK